MRWVDAGRARRGAGRAGARGPPEPGGQVSHRPTMRTSTSSTTKRGRTSAATRPTSTAGTAGAWTSVMRPQTRQIRCWWGVEVGVEPPRPPGDAHPPEQAVLDERLEDAVHRGRRERRHRPPEPPVDRVRGRVARILGQRPVDGQPLGRDPHPLLPAPAREREGQRVGAGRRDGFAPASDSHLGAILTESGRAVKRAACRDASPGGSGPAPARALLASARARRAEPSRGERPPGRRRSPGARSPPARTARA